MLDRVGCQEDILHPCARGWMRGAGKVQIKTVAIDRIEQPSARSADLVRCVGDVELCEVLDGAGDRFTRDEGFLAGEESGSLRECPP